MSDDDNEIPLGDRPRVAMTYALWDAENTTKLQSPENFAAYYKRASPIVTWLTMHGWIFVKELSITERFEFMRMRKYVRRLVFLNGALAIALLIVSWRLFWS